MSSPIKLSGNLKLFTGLILLYFAFQIYFGLLSALLFRLFLYSQTLLYLSEFVNRYLTYVADALLIISGLLLLGISKLNQSKRARIRIGAVFLLILGIYRIFMEVAINYLQSHILFGSIFAVEGALTIASLSLAAVTFLLVGMSMLRKRTRPLIYGGALLLLLFCSLAIVGLILMGSPGYSLVINGNATSFTVSSLFLHMVDFEIYAEWIPPLLFFIAFLFISKDLRESNTVVEEKALEPNSEELDKLVIFEK